MPLVRAACKEGKGGGGGGWGGGFGVAVQEKGLLVCGLAGLLEDVSSRGAAVTGCSGCIRPAVVIGKFTN